jgi:serine/threonine protein kinase
MQKTFDVHPGEFIAGRFTVEKKLGAGGMGVVYAARQHAPMKRRVALKLPRLELWENPEQVFEQTRREAEAGARINHPGFAAIYELSRIQCVGSRHTGRPFIVMELVEGTPLRQLCGKLEISTLERLKLFVRIVAPLAAAYAADLYHRDLKPDNIMLTSDFEVKILDFGLARLREQVSASVGPTAGGTPCYLTIEALRAFVEGSRAPLRPAEDVRALGVIFYELLSGGQHPLGWEFLNEVSWNQRLAARQALAKASQQDSLHHYKPLASSRRSSRENAWLNRECDKLIIRAMGIADGRTNSLPPAALSAEELKAAVQGLIDRCQRRQQRQSVLRYAAAATLPLVLSAASMSRWHMKSVTEETDVDRRLRQEEDDIDCQKEFAESGATARTVIRCMRALRDPLIRRGKLHVASLRTWASTYAMQSAELPLCKKELGANIFALSPDGKRVVARHPMSSSSRRRALSDLHSCAPEKAQEVSLQATMSAQEKQEQQDPALQLAQAVFSPDSRSVLTLQNSEALGREAFLFDTETGAQLGRTRTGPGFHRRLIDEARFLAAGRYLLTVSQGDKALLWNRQSLDPQGRFNLARDLASDIPEIQTTEVSSDGQRLALGGSGGKVQLVTMDALRPLSVPIQIDPPDTVRILRFSPDGKLLAASYGGRTLWIIDAASRVLRHTLVDPRCSASQARCGIHIRSIAFSEDNQLVVAGTDDRASLWRLRGERGEPLQDFQSERGFDAVMIVDRSVVLSASLNASVDADPTAEKTSEIMSWDVTTGNVLWRVKAELLRFEQTREPRSQARIYARTNDGDVHLWDASVWASAKTPFEHQRCDVLGILRALPQLEAQQGRHISTSPQIMACYREACKTLRRFGANRDQVDGLCREVERGLNRAYSLMPGLPFVDLLSRFTN